MNTIDKIFFVAMLVLFWCAVPWGFYVRTLDISHPYGLYLVASPWMVILTVYLIYNMFWRES